MPAPIQMHVAVLIVAFQNATDVVRCLRALARSTYTDFEVVVSENGGDSAYRALVSLVRDQVPKQLQITLIEAPSNGGFASGVNLCLRAVPQADLWWLLNPDTEPTPSAMGALVGRIAQNDCEAVGGTLIFPDGRVQSHGGVWQPLLARAVSIGYGSKIEAPIDPKSVERRLQYLSGASMMITRRFRETVGEMREDYFLYGEEIAWCIEAQRKGMRFGFAPHARVLHHQGTSTGCTQLVSDRSCNSIFLGERNRMLLTRDYFSWLFWFVALVCLVDIVPRYIWHGAWRQISYAFPGWAAGLGNQRGPAKA